MSTPLLSVEGLSTQIDSEGGFVHALDQVSFSVAGGETFALVGESGCGKSMTALSLMRLLPPGGAITGGSVSLEGRNLCRISEAEMRRVRGASMAMIFQEPGTSLNAVLTVGQQIGEVLAIHRRLRGEVAAREAVSLLRQVGIPDPQRRLGEYPFQFSGGMKQRVMIAMALAGEPRLLIADEPTTALDVTIQAQVLEVMRELQRARGMAMILITHDLGVVAKMAQHIGVMYAGHLIEEASRERFFAQPAHPYSRKLFAALPEGRRERGVLATIPGSVPPLTTIFTGCRFAERCDSAWQRCHDEAPAWHEAAAQQRVRCHLFDPAETRHAVPDIGPATRAPGETTTETPKILLEVRDLKVHFPITSGVFRRVIGQVRAVDGIDLEIAEGRTLALVGESGCGKTTVGKAILRLIEPSGGVTRLDGEDVAGFAGARLRAMRASMQMIFQDPFGSLNPRLRVLEIIAEGLRALGSGGSAIEQRRQVCRIMEQVGLRTELVDRYPHEFSGGQRQRIAIARALAVAPRLIICDEPTSALDVSVQAQILNLLQELQVQLGIAYLFITHNIAVVEYLAHDVAVMYLGRIVERGSVQEVLREPLHPYTRALLAAVPRASLAATERVAQVPVAGDLPSPALPPSGCHFHPRCPLATAICEREYPAQRCMSGTHTVRCHNV